jgi:hypothetical protein
VRALFRTLYGPADQALYGLAMRVLGGEHTWLEQGIIPWTVPAEEAPALDADRREAAGVGD